MGLLGNREQLAPKYVQRVEMHNIYHRLLFVAIVALLGVLGILRSNEGFANPPRPNTQPNPAKSAMNAVYEITNMGVTDAQRAKLAEIIKYIKGQEAARMLTGGRAL